MAENKGYHGVAADLINDDNLSIGDRIQVDTSEDSFEGILMPRYELADENHIVLKLKNGYNLGIHIKKITKLSKLSTGNAPTYRSQESQSVNNHLPRVLIVSTGGTIASRIDYRTGGVYPALTANELYSAVPELSEVANIDAEVLFSVFSENISPNHWKILAKRIGAAVNEGYNGVLVTHGTDTMGYTSAAMSFALRNLPIPVLFVGAQRSSDRPSSDAALNLKAATLIASKAPFAGVFLVMHSGLNDNLISVHRGVTVRKNHTSQRAAFESINTSIVASVENGAISCVSKNIAKRGDLKDFKLLPEFDEKVVLVKFYPGFNSEILDFLLEKKVHGIVLEGTGLGHVGHSCYQSIKKFINNDVLVGMTSQCIWGRVNMTVYETGRDLLALGVTPLDSILPETALAKMMWILANTNNVKEARNMLTQNLVGELTSRLHINRCDI